MVHRERQIESRAQEHFAGTDPRGHRDMTLLLLKGYRRESLAECAKSSRARHAGTALDSRQARSRACACIYGVLSRKSLTSTAAWGACEPRKRGIATTVRSSPRDLCHAAVFTMPSKRRRAENRPSSRSGCMKQNGASIDTTAACLTRKMNMSDMHVFL